MIRRRRATDLEPKRRASGRHFAPPTATSAASLLAESRDVNPMHMDGGHARRLLSGRQVVRWRAHADSRRWTGLPRRRLRLVGPGAMNPPGRQPGRPGRVQCVPASRNGTVTAKVDGVVRYDIVLRAFCRRRCPPVRFGSPWRSVGALCDAGERNRQSPGSARRWKSKVLADQLAELYRALRRWARHAGTTTRGYCRGGHGLPGELHSVLTSLQFRFGVATGRHTAAFTTRYGRRRHDPTGMLFIARLPELA